MFQSNVLFGCCIISLEELIDSWEKGAPVCMACEHIVLGYHGITLGFLSE